MSVGTVAAGTTPASVTPNGSTPAAGSTEPVSSGFAAMLAGAIAPHVHVATKHPVAKAASDLGDRANADLSPAGKSDRDATSPVGDPALALASLGPAAVGLNPLLQSRLARIIERMHTEFGRDVRLVEGVRSQQRQNQLFAQGRDTAGPVVTWTRNSLHASGRAADLVINGGYDDATGFALLRQVAEEEGLHTLGAKDPGHLELRGAATPADAGTAATALDAMLQKADVTSAREGRTTLSAPVTRVANPGAIALVATVAAVARVATVARVAQLGAVAAGAVTKPTAPASPAIRHEGTSAPVTPPGANSSNGDSAHGERTGAGSDKQEANVRRIPRSGGGDATVAGRAADAYRSLDGSRGTNGLADSANGDALTEGRATAASQASRVMDAQDAPGPRTLSHLTLSLDDGSGGADQVRIGMRGSSVGASFDMTSAASADRISSRLGELTKALEQRGLEPQAFQVRTASAVREADASRVSTMGSTQQRAVADTAAARNDTQSSFSGDARQRFSQQHEQREQAERREMNQRRHGYSFSLTSEEP